MLRRSRRAEFVMHAKTLIQETLVVVLLVAMGTVAVAQRPTWPTPGTHTYVGEIKASAGPLRIQMTLTLPKQRGELGTEVQAVSGEYRLERQGMAFGLSGDGIDKQGNLVVREYTKPKNRNSEAEDVCTGRFDGTLDAGARQFRGVWIRADNKVRWPFEVKLVAVTQEISISTPLGVHWEQQSLVFFGGSELANATTRALRDAVHAQLDVDCEVEPEASWAEGRVSASKDLRAPTAVGTTTGSQKFAAFHVGEKLVSIGSTSRVDGGGAHPNTYFSCLNLVQRGGKVVPLHLPDLVLTPAAGAELYRLVWSELQRQGASGAQVPPREPSYEKDLANFVLSPAGVVFGFAPYAVGGYVEGSFFVKLSWAELQGVLAPPKELYR